MSGRDGEFPTQPARRALSSGRWVLAALAVYGLLLWLTRPATPLEWDEVLALRGVVRYDVGEHAPQPPGFPAYIGAAKAVRLAVGDPLVALQIVGILAALGALAATWTLARRLGAPALAAAAAAAFVGANPEFLYSAAVGVSDVTGMAAGVAAVVALVGAAGSPTLLPLAGAACGLVLGIRPQTGAVLIPALAWALVAGLRSRRWWSLAAGALAGVATAAACWVPAILATGPRRWWGATRWHVHYIATVEHDLHLPAARLSDVARHWFLGSFVGWEFAVPVWVLVTVGTIVLVRTGRGRLAALAGSSAGCYVLSALFTMNETVSLRYILPALPFLAMLVAGGLTAPHKVVRRSAAYLVALWCLAAIAWTSPALRERRRPAPVWAALTWIREHCSPATTRVVYDGVVTPHVDYLLRSAGYSVFQADKTSILDNLEVPGEQTLFVTPLPVPGADVLFHDRHRTTRVVELAWGRYGSCAVSRMRRTDEAVYSPEWQLTREGWQLWGTGHIALPSASKPAIVRLCAGAETVTLDRPNAPPERVTPGECVVARLAPGPQGALAVSAPTNSTAVLPPIEFLPIAALDPNAGVSSAYLVPQAAHRQGYRGAVWRTDLALINPNRQPIRVAVQFLPTGKDNSGAPLITETIQPSQLRNFLDILTLPEFQSAGSLGALLVYAVDGNAPCNRGDCRFVALSRTYSSPTGIWRSEEWMPGVAAENALGPGEQAVLSHVTRSEEIRTTIGFASWSERPVRVVARVLDAHGSAVETRAAELAPFGHGFVSVGANVEDGRVEVEVAGGARGALIVPYVSMVDRRTGLPTHILADRMPGHAVPEGWKPPLPRQEAAK